MFMLLHPRLGYEYGVASPRVLLAQAYGSWKGVGCHSSPYCLKNHVI